MQRRSPNCSAGFASNSYGAAATEDGPTDALLAHGFTLEVIVR
jgi:hypothetical protein